MTAEGNGEVNKIAWGKENYAYVKERAGVTEVVPGDQCITVLGASGRSRLETVYKPVTQQHFGTLLLRIAGAGEHVLGKYSIASFMFMWPL